MNMTKIVRQTLIKAGWVVVALLLQPVHCQPASQEVSRHYNTRKGKTAATDQKRSGYTPAGYRVQIGERCLVRVTQGLSERLDLDYQKSRGCT